MIFSVFPLFDRIVPPESDVLVIDEFSMITWQMLYHALNKSGAHNFVGDPEQIKPIRGGEVASMIIKTMPPGAVKTLETVYRTKSVVTVIEKWTESGQWQRLQLWMLL